MNGHTNDRPGHVTVGAAWMGLDPGQLADLIARQLLNLGATVTSTDADGTIFRLDATVGSLLRRRGLTIRNVRRVTANHGIVDGNRGLIASNRRWIDEARLAISVRSKDA